MLSLLRKRRLGVQDFPGFGGFSLLFYLYLYAPIVVLVVYSFNANQSATVWTGFSLDWYRAAFANQALRSAAGNSLLIAVCASMIATAIATLAALGTSRGAKFTLFVDNGAEGVTQAVRRTWAMVFVDLQMPGLDGFETTRMIRQKLEGRPLPIVAVTANARAEDRAAAAAAGMDDFLTKPVRHDELRACLERWLPPAARRST